MKSGFASLFIATTFILSACASTPVASPTPMETLIETAPATEVQPEATDECITCHTDKQRLIDTIKPEEIVVKESSGTG